MFEWNGKLIQTTGDLVAAISKLSSRAEAQEFMRAYRETGNEHVDADVGYCIGYVGGVIDPKDAQRRAELHDWTSTGHPVFGARTY